MLLCPWESPLYFVYSSNIPTLFFYSHTPAVLVALIVGFLVFFKSGKSKIGSSLLAVSILFSLWCIFDLLIWATNRPDVVLFFWSLQILFEPLVYLLCFYMVYLFVINKDLDFKWKLAGIASYLPILVLLPTAYNLIGIDIGYCNAVEGFIAQYYTYIIEGAVILAIIFFIVSQYFRASAIGRRREMTVFALGVLLFLVAFSSGNLIGSFTENWTLAQAGLIGMPIFMGFLAYMIVRFKTFNIKLIATQVLMAVIWLLVLGILFVRTIENVRIVTALTLILVTIAGDLLIKSVTREVKQREQLAELIKQRESLVHLVTHKVKGSFTRSKYVFAGILDGTFGEISPEVRKYAEQGLESNVMGIETVDLVLNADNLQKGIVKYDMKPFNMKEIVERVIAEKDASVKAKGLTLESNLGEGNFNILGDSFWVKEVVNNLIENSIKYTPSGKITVGLEDGNGKVKLSVKDSGVGISDEDKKLLFTEGGRGKDSVRINVDSTGYGLYSVKLILDAHKARVWAESEGRGKGSQFYAEFDAVSGTA